MAWELTGDRPIYAQLITCLTMDVLSGRFQIGEKLPSVRDLAAEAGVNPNTMQRALSQLEQEGLICTQRTTGRTVTKDQSYIDTARETLAGKRTGEYIVDMSKLGYQPEALAALIEKYSKERTE